MMILPHGCELCVSQFNLLLISHIMDHTNIYPNKKQKKEESKKATTMRKAKKYKQRY